MSVEVDVLLQEAKESIEAAQNYRSELQQRLHGLNQARKQVPPPPGLEKHRLKEKQIRQQLCHCLVGVRFLLLFLLIFLQPVFPSGDKTIIPPSLSALQMRVFSLKRSQARPGRYELCQPTPRRLYSPSLSLLSLPSSCCLDLPIQLLTVNNAAISCRCGRTKSLRDEDEGETRGSCSL